ncbi:sulfite exporter TauE/SafE family protein [Bacillus sp. DTU_2020_1000418_1_SI_GHA_SEK_038]|uniref:sulfite exporter TauE/SafE family protein n=1 Tax=Bacillus sp. DTU_2020_1000418_1_SI_GHA_SEK_038 TaxID=3077585 RepID=UPI0028E83BD9|nr:sulfite exporter TauE/SafE family protein [Bacillus sp. DTU_2020_1000418_1_SI_GHA_SEK_038]WNS76213.1 sulfite exporter TauE/SafE family protein [Bacillus sp. DTU_2020_1000418_1_SI_GHA_SEK_038]
MYLTMLLIGFLSGMITGLLSIGGGIIVVFMLMFVFPLLTGKTFPMHTIAGFSIMQTFFSTLSGGFYYIRNKLVERKVVLIMGIPAFIGGMIGVLLASYSSDFLLRTIFAFLAVTAAIVMQIPYKSNEESEPFKFTIFSTILTVLACFMIGISGGLVGIAAGFIFVPLMIFVFKIPIKNAIGSSLLICFLLASGSLITKLSISSIPIGYAFMLIIGGIVGAQIGGRITKRLNSITLKRIAAYLILLVSIKLFFDIYS